MQIRRDEPVPRREAVAVIILNIELHGPDIWELR